MAGPKTAGWTSFDEANSVLLNARDKVMASKPDPNLALNLIAWGLVWLNMGIEDSLQELYERMQRLHQKIDRIEKKIGSV